MVGGILFFFSLESHVDVDDDEYFWMIGWPRME